MTTAEMIQTLAKTGEEIYGKICKVISVDTDRGLCDVEPLDGSAKIYDVRLQASDYNSDGILLIPKVDSFVIVNFLNKNAGFIALAGSLEEIRLHGDQYGGLIKIEELKAQLEKNTARIDWILNLLKSQITGVSLQPNPSWQATITPQIELLDKENYSNIENNIVKHG